MAITNEGQGSVELTGVGTTNISVPGGAASGDDIYIHVTAEKASGGYPPSSVSGASPLATVGETTVYHTHLTGSPPSDYTVNFGAATDVHGWIKITVFRGAHLYGTRGYKTATGYTKSSVTSETLPDFATSINGTTQLVFFGARGAVVTVPSEETGLYASAHTGPPALSVAAGYNTVPTPSVVTGQDVTLASANTLDVVLITLTPDDESAPYLANWTALDGFPETYSLDPGAMISDNSGTNVFYLGVDETTGEIRITKIDRVAHTITLSATLTGYSPDYLSVGNQDTTHLYIAVSGGRLLKVAKSDLSVAAVSAAVPNLTVPYSPDRVMLGTGWNSGKIWGLAYAAGEAANHEWRLVSWDLSTLTVVDDVDLLGGDSAKDGTYGMIIATSGDLYVAYREGTGFVASYTGILKVASDLSVTFLNLFDGSPEPAIETTGDSADQAMVYDAANERIILWSSYSTLATPEYSRIVLYDIAGNTQLANINYNHLVTGYGWMTGVNGLRAVLGIPSLFVGVWDGTLSYANSESLLQLNSETLDVLRVFEPPSGYMSIHHAWVSPEGEVWMGAKAPDFSESLLIFAVEDALGGPPDPSPSWLRPLFGRGHGFRRRFDGQ